MEIWKFFGFFFLKSLKSPVFWKENVRFPNSHVFWTSGPEVMSSRALVELQPVKPNYFMKQRSSSSFLLT